MAEANATAAARVVAAFADPKPGILQQARWAGLGGPASSPRTPSSQPAGTAGCMCVNRPRAAAAGLLAPLPPVASRTPQACAPPPSPQVTAALEMSYEGLGITAADIGTPGLTKVCKKG